MHTQYRRGGVSTPACLQFVAIGILILWLVYVLLSLQLRDAEDVIPYKYKLYQLNKCGRPQDNANQIWREGGYQQIAISAYIYRALRGGELSR